MGLQIVKKVKYLGIWLSPRCSSLKEDNYVKLIKQIRKELELWAKLKLSISGRIAMLKINTLPKLIYLFQMIPIKLGKSFFIELNKMASNFVWLGKRPRIKMKQLQDNRSRGGLGLPEWELYYQAAVLSWIKDWVKLRYKRILTLEGHDLIGWHAFLWENKSNVHTYFNQHLIRDSLITTWKENQRQALYGNPTMAVNQ
uniref:Reverse transcriptase domain-containing protein n=1 Tax=Micrurus lemniscatus lemniscatus TaxID=129467 RepID=A0A2D4IH83_MICLE